MRQLSGSTASSTLNLRGTYLGDPFRDGTSQAEEHQDTDRYELLTEVELGERKLIFL